MTVHRRFEFEMAAPELVVFDAFHYHHWRHQWDTLVRDTRVEGGAPCPSVGAVTSNLGRGPLRALSMRTRFVSYEPGRVAAAAMAGQSFPFTRWAACMQHKPAAPGRSIMIYTYTFDVGPSWLRWLMEPAVQWTFDRQTRKRFAQLQQFVHRRGQEVAAWQSGLATTESRCDTAPVRNTPSSSEETQ